MSSYVPLPVAVVRRETALAVQVVSQERGAPFLWLPKSQIAHCDTAQAGRRGFTLWVTPWIMAQKLAESNLTKRQATITPRDDQMVA